MLTITNQHLELW